MDNKFLVTNGEWVRGKLESWKCVKCGSKEEPLIMGKDTQKEDDLDMYIICKKCKYSLKITSL